MAFYMSWLLTLCRASRLEQSLISCCTIDEINVLGRQVKEAGRVETSPFRPLVWIPPTALAYSYGRNVWELQEHGAGIAGFLEGLHSKP